MLDKMKMQDEAQKYKEGFVGFRFKHFKGGIYVVVDIAIHSESAEPMVIYKSFDNPKLVWCRPFKMFVSEVDHIKYPNVTQKMRFERIGEDE